MKKALEFGMGRIFSWRLSSVMRRGRIIGLFISLVSSPSTPSSVSVGGGSCGSVTRPKLNTPPAPPGEASAAAVSPGAAPAFGKGAPVAGGFGVEFGLEFGEAALVVGVPVGWSDDPPQPSARNPGLRGESGDARVLRFGEGVSVPAPLPRGITGIGGGIGGGMKPGGNELAPAPPSSSSSGMTGIGGGMSSRPGGKHAIGGGIPPIPNMPDGRGDAAGIGGPPAPPVPPATSSVASSSELDELDSLRMPAARSRRWRSSRSRRLSSRICLRCALSSICSCSRIVSDCASARLSTAIARNTLRRMSASREQSRCTASQELDRWCTMYLSKMRDWGSEEESRANRLELWRSSWQAWEVL